MMAVEMTDEIGGAEAKLGTHLLHVPVSLLCVTDRCKSIPGRCGQNLRVLYAPEHRVGIPIRQMIGRHRYPVLVMSTSGSPSNGVHCPRRRAAPIAKFVQLPRSYDCCAHFSRDISNTWRVPNIVVEKESTTVCSFHESRPLQDHQMGNDGRSRDAEVLCKQNSG